MKIRFIVAIAVCLALSAGTSLGGNNPEGMPPKEKEISGFGFRVPHCAMYPSKKTVECSMTIANRGRTRSFHLSASDMKIVDNYENDYTPARMVLGSDVGKLYVSVLFESGVAHELVVTFKGVAARASLIKSYSANFKVTDKKSIIKAEPVVVEFKDIVPLNAEAPPPPPPPAGEGNSSR